MNSSHRNNVMSVFSSIFVSTIMYSPNVKNFKYLFFRWDNYHNELE